MNERMLPSCVLMTSRSWASGIAVLPTKFTRRTSTLACSLTWNQTSTVDEVSRFTSYVTSAM